MSYRPFRAKRIDNGELVYGDRVKQCTGEVYIVTNSMNEYGKVSFDWFEVNPETVGRSIGKKDTKGRGIYSGMTIAVSCDRNDNCLVVYDEEESQYMLKKSTDVFWAIIDFDEIEIVNEEDTKDGGYSIEKN